MKKRWCGSAKKWRDGARKTWRGGAKTWDGGGKTWRGGVKTRCVGGVKIARGGVGKIWRECPRRKRTRAWSRDGKDSRQGF